MRKIYVLNILWMFTLVILLISGCATTRNIPNIPPENRKQVLVFQFDDESTYSYGRIHYDATEFMEEALAQTGQVRVISGDVWKAQVPESGVMESSSDLIAQARQVGEIVGADAVIIGTIQDFWVDEDHDSDGPIISQRHEYSAITHVKAELIDVDAAHNVTTVRATGSAEERTVRFFSEGPLSVDAVNERRLLNEALQDAAQQLAYDIVEQLYSANVQ